MTTTAIRDGVTQLQQDIKRLAKERNAVILAHNYERPEVQDVADFVRQLTELGTGHPVQFGGRLKL